MIKAEEARIITEGGLADDKKTVEQLIPKIESLIVEASKKGRKFVEAFVYSPVGGDEILVGGIESQKKGLFERQTTKRVSDSIINGLAKILYDNGYSAQKFECGGSMFEGEYEMYTTGKIGHIIQVRW